MTAKTDPMEFHPYGKRDERPQCCAWVSVPPYYIQHYQCDRNATGRYVGTFDDGATEMPVCGTHRRYAERHGPAWARDRWMSSKRMADDRRARGWGR